MEWNCLTLIQCLRHSPHSCSRIRTMLPLCTDILKAGLEIQNDASTGVTAPFLLHGLYPGHHIFVRNHKRFAHDAVWDTHTTRFVFSRQWRCSIHGRCKERCGTCDAGTFMQCSALHNLDWDHLLWKLAPTFCRILWHGLHSAILGRHVWSHYYFTIQRVILISILIFSSISEFQLVWITFKSCWCQIDNRDRYLHSLYPVLSSNYLTIKIMSPECGSYVLANILCSLIKMIWQGYYVYGTLYFRVAYILLIFGTYQIMSNQISLRFDLDQNRIATLLTRI